MARVRAARADGTVIVRDRASMGRGGAFQEINYPGAALICDAEGMAPITRLMIQLQICPGGSPGDLIRPGAARVLLRRGAVPVLVTFLPDHFESGAASIARNVAA
jgi:hypothetical protein